MARAAIVEGRLPRCLPERIWGGRGGGIACALCRVPVGAHQMEFEFDVALNGCSPESHHMHLRCFEAWKLECHAFSKLSGTSGARSLLGGESEGSQKRGSV
jgi:hypothetical protein